MHIDEYLIYLAEEGKKSDNTIEAYKRDIQDFRKYMKTQGSNDIDNASETDVAGYLLELKKAGKTGTTLNRKLAGIRGYFAFLTEKGHISRSPAVKISVPRVERKEIEYLSYEEVMKLLDETDDLRDRAILETMYATGMRASEVIEAKVSDVDLEMGYMSFSGRHGRARIVPLGVPSRNALREYIKTSRVELIGEQEDSDILFVNYLGKAMTRQGLWKILKACGRKADIEEKMSPHILRSSFAVHMAQNGADIRSLQELMGHEDISATQAYLDVVKPRIKDVYDRTHPRAR